MQNKGNNASLIDFSVSTICNKNNQADEFDFIPVIEEDNNKKNEVFNSNLNKQSGFSFINNNKNNSASTIQPNQSNANAININPSGGSLIDLQSYESQKSNKIKLLTDNISSVYNNPVQGNDPNKSQTSRNMNYMQMNQPNINISNTYFNMNYPNNIGGGMNTGMQTNLQGGNMHGMNMNGMNNSNMNMYPNNMMNPYMNPNVNRMAPIQQQSVQGIPNNPSFNYDYYNNINNKPSISGMNYGMGMGSGLGPFSDLGSSLGHTQNTKKKEDDPFKSLLTFK